MADPDLKVKGVGVEAVFFACSVDLSSFLDFFFFFLPIRWYGKTNILVINGT